MKKIHFCLLICLIIVGFLSSAGCISSKITDNNSTSPPYTFLPRTPYPTSTPVHNRTEHITINPVSMHYIGEIFEINGTTDFAPNEKILVSISPEPHSTCYHCPMENWGMDGYAVIKPGQSGKNTWSFLVNTTGFSRLFTMIIVRSENNTIRYGTVFYLCGNISQKDRCENCSRGLACS
jgi:hypothetical protein